MCAIPLHDEMVATSRETLDLRQVPRWYRSKAVEDAFEVQKKIDWVTGRSVLLVDDIITTGSTIKEMAKLMIGHGAAEVAAVALCYTEN
jgi:competence protein ComFC